ncbi:hypothetical protein PN441_16280 [Spirulina major CS-329]|uniref:hypothetical protein n=1 Tax=Spirulina TaxID=1154 RepID=UPI00232EAD2E|nr:MULTISPECIES: hypothetical protein [Spirulina]MDB9493028.1 hypothetical protein [Spirulina subsalsa CS-330]MDB9504637.1 hypothetical protein [Spirulina major CS-329]
MLSFWITLHTKQVCLKTKLPEIAALITGGFAALLGKDEQQSIAELQINQQHENYYVIDQNSDRVLDISDNCDHCFIQIKYHVMTALIQAHSQWLWFHAGAVANPEGAIVFPADAGGGKSTFTTYFTQQGWQYCSDDVVPLNFYTQQIYPVPQTPRPRAATSTILSPDQLTHAKKQAVKLTAQQISHQAHPITVMIFPRYQPDAETILSPCSVGQSMMNLLRNCINFPIHKTQVIPFLVTLIQEIHRFELVYSDRTAACSQLEHLSQRNWSLDP